MQRKKFFVFLGSIIVATSHIQTTQCIPTVYNLSAKRLVLGVIGLTFVGFYLGSRVMQDMYEEVDKNIGLPLRKNQKINEIAKETIDKQLKVMIGGMEKEVGFFYAMRNEFNRREQREQLCSGCPGRYLFVTKIFRCNFNARANEMNKMFKQATKRIEDL